MDNGDQGIKAWSPFFFCQMLHVRQVIGLPDADNF
jgi:hypothetical protein